MPSSKARRRRREVLRTIEAHVRERREVWGPARTLQEALYVAGVHESKLGRDYEELRKADQEVLFGEDEAMRD